jgi:hypothetical protein
VKGKEAVAMDTTDGLSWSILGKNLHTDEFKSQEISIATVRNQYPTFATFLTCHLLSD